MAKGEVTVGVIGLGLMGGSVALKLKVEGFMAKAIGYDINPDHAERAKEIGIIDDYVYFDRLLTEADIIVLAIPVDKAVVILPDVLKSISESTVVLDLGSTKEKICAVADKQANRHFPMVTGGCF